jgi:hypothetical protein
MPYEVSLVAKQYAIALYLRQDRILSALLPAPRGIMGGFTHKLCGLQEVGLNQMV